MRLTFPSSQTRWSFQGALHPPTMVSPRCLSKESNSDGLTVDIKRYIDETEKNIVELNRSRLKALEDVSHERLLRLSAEHKLALLEEKVIEMEEEMNKLKLQLGESLLNGDSYQQEKLDLKNEEESVEDPPLTAGVINLRYKTSWRNAYIHFRVDSKGWTKIPGMKMANHEKYKFISIEGNYLEFVLNNGRDDWDKPFTGENELPLNYQISSAGNYFLHNGYIKSDDK